MKYLYVLVSSPKDIYYELFLLSATSLKLLMPHSDIVLLCDSKTMKTLTGKRSGYEKLVSKVITADAPSEMSQVEVSRWVKTSMRRLVSGDFLFIDCDTIITGELSSITSLGVQFAACLDKHFLLDRHNKRNDIIEKEKLLGFNSWYSNRHFNSGVIFCVDTPEIHKIFNRWHELWLFGKSKNIVRDQISFNMAIYENSTYFTELDGTWNCQITFNGLPYLINSKIIHYFASDLTLHTSPFHFASEEISKKIKNTGTIPDETLELLKNPRSAFVSESRIIAGEDMLFVINSSFFEMILWIKQKIPYLFHFLNLLSSTIKKIGKGVFVRKNRKKDGGIKFYN